MLDCVLVVKGPGLATVVDAKRKEVPVTSINSTRTVFEKAAQEVWKYLIPPPGTAVVTLSPGLTMAGAADINNS